MQPPNFQEAFPSCPVPLPHRSEITLGHGGGGQLTQDLIDRVFRSAFSNPALDAQHDGALLRTGAARLAFTTDSHVVSPLFFPGGDLGKLAVNGTVNDLAMCGARPLWLGAAFILEEGFPISTLERLVASMREASAKAGVCIVTGDTKVVERGKGDGVYVTTSGIGAIEHDVTVSPSEVRPGDAILLSGDIGRHGMAVMATRERLSFENPIESDCASLADTVRALLDAGITPHCLRDLTRGGLATALIEIAEQSSVSFVVDEAKIPLSEPVHGACEILGLDPLYVACEGRFICILPDTQASRALEILSHHALGSPPSLIGRVDAQPTRRVILRSVIGVDRFIERLSGEQLPRIC